MTSGDGDELERRLDRWVAEGLISESQALSIRAAESGREGPPTSGPRRAAVREAVGYLGAAIAAVSIGLLIHGFWADLETWARLALVALGTALAAGAAAVVAPNDHVATRRFAHFLMLLALGGGALLTRLVADDVLGWAGQNIATLTGAVVLVPAVVLLRRRDSGLVHLAALAAATILVVGLVTQYDDAELDVIGAAVWGLGSVWALLTWGEVLPVRRVGFLLGGIEMVVGAEMVTSVVTAPGVTLGLASAAALLAAGSFIRSPMLSGAGVVAVFAFVGQGVAHYAPVGDEGDRFSSLALTSGLLIVGLALLGTALVGSRPSSGRESQRG